MEACDLESFHTNAILHIFKILLLVPCLLVYFIWFNLLYFHTSLLTIFLSHMKPKLYIRPLYDYANAAVIGKFQDSGWSWLLLFWMARAHNLSLGTLLEFFAWRLRLKRRISSIGCFVGCRPNESSGTQCSSCIFVVT